MSSGAEKTLDQQVVIYDRPGETGVVYDTAYTPAQIERVLLRCRNIHGAKCHARAIPASRRSSGDKR